MVSRCNAPMRVRAQRKQPCRVEAGLYLPVAPAVSQAAVRGGGPRRRGIATDRQPRGSDHARASVATLSGAYGGALAWFMRVHTGRGRQEANSYRRQMWRSE